MVARHLQQIHCNKIFCRMYGLSNTQSTRIDSNSLDYFNEINPNINGIA